MKAIEMLKRSFEKTPKPTARVVVKDLVVSLPNAIKPCVWRTNLDEVKSALFEVDLVNASYQLIMKSNHDTKEIISSYETQEDAVEALNVISKALLTANARSSSAQAANTDDEEKPLGFFKSFIIFLAFFFVFVFIAGLFVDDAKEEIARDSQEVQLEKTENKPVVEQSDKTGQAGKEGVPLSADDILGGGQ